MSDALRCASSPSARGLRDEEIALISSLLNPTPSGGNLEETLQSSRVTDMKDGGMGSIRFVRDEPRILGKVLQEAQYTDEDGVPVSIAINADNKGDLFEVDFWKVDFSPLKRYPKPSDLHFVRN